MGNAVLLWFVVTTWIGIGFTSVFLTLIVIDVVKSIRRHIHYSMFLRWLRTQHIRPKDVQANDVRRYYAETGRTIF